MELDNMSLQGLDFALPSLRLSDTQDVHIWPSRAQTRGLQGYSQIRDEGLDRMITGHKGPRGTLKVMCLGLGSPCKW